MDTESFLLPANCRTIVPSHTGVHLVHESQSKRRRAARIGTYATVVASASMPFRKSSAFSISIGPGSTMASGSGTWLGAAVGAGGASIPSESTAFNPQASHSELHPLLAPLPSSAGFNGPALRTEGFASVVTCLPPRNLITGADRFAATTAEEVATGKGLGDLDISPPLDGFLGGFVGTCLGDNGFVRGRGGGAGAGAGGGMEEAGTEVVIGGRVAGVVRAVAEAIVVVVAAVSLCD